jgi:hypothetical protein
MILAIDISQIVYEGTGVRNYVRNFVAALAGCRNAPEIILLGMSLRRRGVFANYLAEVKKINPRVTGRFYPLPPTLMHFLWNVLHILPVTLFTGKIDAFWSSDWTQPPLGSVIGMTTIHDLSFLRYPESYDRKILTVQKARLDRVKQECRIILCDSQATRQDVVQKLGIRAEKLYTVYPGFTGFSL